MTAGYPPPLSLSQRGPPYVESDDDDDDDDDYDGARESPTGQPSIAIGAAPASARLPRRRDSTAPSHSQHAHPRPLPTPSRPIASPIPHNLLPSAPASPPTPAPSPTPHQRAPSWTDAGENEDAFLRDARSHFSQLDGSERQRFLAEVLNLCDSQQLSFVHGFVSPRLKKDPFNILPNELCLRILAFVDDPKTLARASQVSSRWHELLSDDLTWKILCDKHAYRRLSDNSSESLRALVETPPPPPPPPGKRAVPYTHRSRSGSSPVAGDMAPPLFPGRGRHGAAAAVTTRSFDGASSAAALGRGVKTMSYKSHFKQRYMVETAWRSGGRAICRHITPDQGVVTSLHLTPKYIVAALDNAKIHVFGTGGEHQKTLSGHVMGVWAMVPWGDILVSGGCDRDVRVWNMATGESVHVLRGHTSTVRCLKMSADGLAISGSRDTTLRVWDIEKGLCKNVLVGHGASVRCLAIKDDVVVSGSYDTMARVWSISEGRCLRVLNGHFSQIYAVAYDGHRIATGSLDTSVRIWDAHTGQCQAILQGHTSLVGQLQMRGNTLVTGGSDGSVRVWSLKKMAPIHRLAAHDNSVTSLQFDETRVVSGGSDGRVKVWDLKTGALVRELSTPAQTVWRVVFEEEKAVIMASRADKTIMEVWSFSPPPEALLDEHERSGSPMSLPEALTAADDHEHDMKMVDALEANLGTSV
ncbi:MAG: hypothetical protein M1832_000311 [Thelocarpon impressellum]|nr:MAG: hypothetical protein M1832_000311 [Thelocarpon impressellum]